MEYLLPEHLFEALATPWLLLIIVISLLVVGKGADIMVDGAVGLASRLGMPKMIVGATILSLGTTTPEAAVSVLAAFKGMPDFALGNSIGSIICDTGLIFGMSCLMARLPIDRFVMKRQGWLQFGSGALLFILCFSFKNTEGQYFIPRTVGFVLVGLLVAYMLISVVWARQHGLQAAPVHGSALEDHDATHASLGLLILMMAGGLILVLISSHTLLQSVRVSCLRLGVSPAIVASTLIAFGTSLPELVTALTCIRKNHMELLVGNIIGADILNVLFVTGAAAAAVPLTVDPVFHKLHLPVMLLSLIIFRVSVVVSKDHFARWPGFLLLALFAVYLAGNVVLGSPLH